MTTYADYLARFFDGKIQKISIDTAHGCPNRDGTIGRGGCAYCSNKAFSPLWEKSRLSVSAQIDAGIQFFAGKYPHMRYLAYFQSYTSTFASTDTLMADYREALSHPQVVGIVIGTRPDCMPDSLLEALATLPGKVFIEFGAESSHNSTLERINRCHTWEQTVDAVRRTVAAGFPVGLHFIMGLPGETEDMMLQTVERIDSLPVDTVKFHHLQILKGTPLGKMWESGEELDIVHFTPETYGALCRKIIAALRGDIVIERFLAQAPADMLLYPNWGLKNYQFAKYLRE